MSRVRHSTRGPVRYGPRRRRVRQAPRLELDRQLLEQLRQPDTDGRTLPVTGECHDCHRPVSGERRFCGPCLAGHGAS